MFETIRGGRSVRNAGKADRRGADPLARTIVRDLLITTSGFLLIVVAVILAVRALSLN